MPTLRPVAAAFVCFGAFWGSWAVAAFDVQRFLGVSDGGLGVLLAVTVVAGSLANAVGGTVAERHGTSAVLGAALLVWGGLIAAMAAIRQPFAFAVIFVATVAIGGLVDVVMNVAATAGLTGAPGRLLRFHALFNLGALVGAGLTGAALAADVSWRLVWAAVGAGGLAVGVVCARAHLPAGDRGEQHTIREGLGALRRAGLLSLAAVFACGAAVEGGVGTWGVLYLRSHLEIAALTGAAAYVTGQALATLARATLASTADALGERHGAHLGTALAAGGLLLEATVDHAAVAGLGLAAAAVGSAMYWPLLLALVARGRERPGVIVGGVTAAGYIGFLAGPPLVGWLADGFGLRAGLLALVVAALAATVAPLRIPDAAAPSAVAR